MSTLKPDPVAEFKTVNYDLNAHEKINRDKLVEEYLIDYDWVNACVRVGYDPKMAQEYSQHFREDKYVQAKISERMGSQSEEDNQQALDNRILTSLMREANYRGPDSSHSARVSALKELAAIKGLHAPIKTKSEIDHLGGLNLSHGIDFESLSTEKRDIFRKLLQDSTEE